jgi:hypothetical protein
LVFTTILNKLLKKHWFTKYSITFLLLCSSCIKAVAQNSFIIKIPAFGAYDPNVFEDEKGCIIAKYDYGITRINPNGRILWKTKDKNLLNGACIKDSQYNVFPAMDSEMGGFRFQAIDYTGKTKWMEREDFSEIRMQSVWDFIIDSVRQQYIVAGERGIVGDLKNIYYWMAGLNYNGQMIWENEWRDSGKSRYFIRILPNKSSGGYMLLSEEMDKYDRKELISVDTLGNVLSRNLIEPDICKDDRAYIHRLEKSNFCEFKNGYLGIVYLSDRSICTKMEEGDYFYTYDDNGNLLTRTLMEDENRVLDISITPKGDILGLYADTQYRLGMRLLDDKFKTKWQTIVPNMPIINDFFDFKVITSKDGGYIGIASQLTFPENQYYIYVYKTDSLGRINPKDEFVEKQQPIMLQPNPAKNNVKIVMPYYYGTINAKFYSMQGEFLFESNQSEQDNIDISSLSPGIYIVKAKVEETGEERTMRLFVD